MRPGSGKKSQPRTLEGRESQMVSLAENLAEKQLREGTASAQVITHYLKLGTSRERLEQEKLTRENLLLDAKAELLTASKRNEELFMNAIEAMKGYSGREERYLDEDD